MLADSLVVARSPDKSGTVSAMRCFPVLPQLPNRQCRCKKAARELVAADDAESLKDNLL